MTRLRCNCCGRVITGATYDAAHTYRLPVFELVRYQGKPAALRKPGHHVRGPLTLRAALGLDTV